MKALYLLKNVTKIDVQITGKVFSHAEDLRAHMHNNCLVKFFKCAECPLAFKSHKTIMKHTKETHPKTAMLYRSIFKCPLCDTVFHDKESPNVAKHLMEHAKSFQATVFHCLVCPEVFDTTSELAEHLSSGEQKKFCQKRKKRILSKF